MFFNNFLQNIANKCVESCVFDFCWYAGESCWNAGEFCWDAGAGLVLVPALAPAQRESLTITHKPFGFKTRMNSLIAFSGVFE